MRNVVAVLLVSILLTSIGLLTAPCTCARPGPDPNPPGHGTDSLRNKGVLIGLPPGVIVAHFAVKGRNTPLFDEMGRPNGDFLGDIIGAADGKPVDVSLVVSTTEHSDTATQNRLFIWTEEGGYELLSSLTVLGQAPDTSIWIDNPPLES